MTELKYCYQDFLTDGVKGRLTLKDMAAIAQRIHDDWVRARPTIYAAEAETIESLVWQQDTTILDHYKAKLIAIEEIDYNV